MHSTPIGFIPAFASDEGDKFNVKWGGDEDKIRGNVFFRVLERDRGPIIKPSKVPNATINDHVFIVKDLSQKIIAVGDSRLGPSRSDPSTLNIIIDSKLQGALAKSIAVDIVDCAVTVYINRLRQDKSDYGRDRLMFLFTTTLDVLEELKVKNKYLVAKIAEISNNGSKYTIQRAESDGGSEPENIECGSKGA